MKTLLLVTLFLLLSVPAAAQWILHPVKPLEHTKTEVAGFVSFDGITMLSAQYRMGFSATSDAAVTLSYGSEDPVSVLEIGLDYNMFMPNLLPPQVLFSINPFVDYYGVSVNDAGTTTITVGCWALFGYEIMPMFAMYGGLDLAYSSTSIKDSDLDSEGDFDADIAIGGTYDLNEKLKLQFELSNILDDDLYVSLGARYGL